MTPLAEPGTSPTVLLTFATSGGNLKARRVGNVTSSPEPTITLIAPAAAIASASIGVTVEQP